MVIGWEGTIYYLGAAATGATYLVLIDETAMLKGVIDPVATAFRSRCYSMVTIGSDLLPSPDDDERVIVWFGRASLPTCNLSQYPRTRCRQVQTADRFSFSRTPAAVGRRCDGLSRHATKAHTPKG
jgi:hypothetical protein